MLRTFSGSVDARQETWNTDTSVGTRTLTPQERVALLRLARTEGVGPISFFHLLQRFKSAEEALDRLPSMARRRTPVLASREQVLREIDEHVRRGYHLISIFDSTYPPYLRALKDAPPFLTLRGRVDLLQETLLGIVGARNASHAGERLASQIAQDVSHRWVTVSGLARGIDGCVHRASLEGRGTIAVVAGSVDAVYPPEHKALHREISEKGLLISEDPLDQQPSAPLFLKRNRLISGLSWGVVVIEASAKSGSLMTAKYAADQGRTVMAVPGNPLDFRARGTNRLIKQGACLVESAEDIFQEFQGHAPHLAREDADAWGGAPSGLFGFTSFWDESNEETAPETRNPAPTSDAGVVLIRTHPAADYSQDNKAHTIGADHRNHVRPPCAGVAPLVLGEGSENDALSARLASLLTVAPVPVRDLAIRMNISETQVRIILIEMELNGEIQRYPGDSVMAAPTDRSYA